MATVHNEASAGQRSARADRISRVITGFNAFLTIIALSNGIYTLFRVSSDHLIVEGWRTFGFVVFFTLFVLITLWPRQIPGAWEVIIFHKVAITLFAIALGDAAEAQRTALIDGWLVISVIPAYILSRGWVAWRTLSKTHAEARNLTGSHA